MIKAKGKRQGPISADKVKSYVDRIEKLEEERQAINGDVRDIYTEAKGSGYNPKALRKVIAQRRQKTDEEVEAEVERYRTALGMASYREVSAALGVSKSKLHRLVPRKTNGTPATPHDPKTGEAGEERCGSERPPTEASRIERPSPCEGHIPRSPPQRADDSTITPTGEDDDTDGRSESANELPALGTEARAGYEPGRGDERGTEAVRLRDGREEGGGESDRGQETPVAPTDPNDDAFRAKVKAIAASVPRPKAPAASDTVIARAPDDDLTIPPFLRREREHA